MSRKSSRIQTKQKDDSTEREVCRILRRKRKATDAELDSGGEVNKRRQQFQIQNQWIPISHDSSIVTSTIIPTTKVPCPNRTPTPQQEILTTGSRFRFQNYFTTPIAERHSPLPSFTWADSSEVWHLMLKKDAVYSRDSQLLNRHPNLQSRMRAILLDWLIEVCEVYRLQRDSFCLAVDFVDRYLAKEQNIKKNQLQLLGITALFIAAKLEEIYPPKLSEFAYVTDGACTESEILDKELVMLKVLNWDLSPMTVNSWLNVYLQLANVENIEDSENNFVFPQYSGHGFVQISRLVDLCLLDVECLQYSYSVIAASAIYHMASEHIALSVSGFKWADLAPCVQWMTPFAMTIREVGTCELKFFQNIPAEDTHSIQTHVVNLSLLEKAQARQKQINESSRSSPDVTQELSGILTPPQSNDKKQAA